MKTSVTRIHHELPIFLLHYGHWEVLYTPGHLSVLEPEIADLICLAWEHRILPQDPTARQIALWLQARAKETVEERQRQTDASFTPECLTVYLSNQCHLACSYCYVSEQIQQVDREQRSLPVVSEKAVSAAARLVAGNCAEQGKPFYLVLHGGGEPTLQWEVIEHLEASTRQITRQFGIAWHGYLATNGVCSPEKARWLAEHFNTVGLSCDGPPDIQNVQRPCRDGKSSSPFVERTARMLKNAGGQVAVRATITPQTVERQAEIVAYLHEQLFAEDIRFEPVYQVRGQANVHFRSEDAAHFAEHFLHAQQEARKRGINLTFSGVRLDEIHASYCDVLRNVLHLNPDGTATACFFSTGSQGNEASYVIGSWDGASGTFILDRERIQAHRQAALTIPESCQNCLNLYHCARGCPEICFVTDNDNFHNMFRCNVQQHLARTWILEAAGKMIEHENIPYTLSSPKHQAEDEFVMRYFRNVPAQVDVESILRQWKAVRTTYRIEERRMPSPVWAERGFEHSGREAWEQLSHGVAQCSFETPMAIYIHIPFCDRRCKFCDCYAFPFGKLSRDTQEARYTQTLLAEIDAWAKLPSLSRRPVSTVHFGGGTPNCLTADVLSGIVDHCRTHFNITPETEFALESTSSLLTPDHLLFLRQFGFSRLHVGVQTLEEPLRQTIGRRESAGAVLEKLSNALNAGFITSVDVLYGLPGQTIAGLLHTLESLAAGGIHGVSLYRLNISQRNEKFLMRTLQFTPDRVADYVLFQVAEQCLTDVGFRKNHFTHFARPEDRNLYYTHAKRGEDLLALGTTADGVFGAYHYRHPEYQAYIAGEKPNIPVLEGGLWETPREQRLHPAITSLLTGSIRFSVLQELQVESLFEQWRSNHLLKDALESDTWILTANGSWFVDMMISELKQRLFH